MSAKGSDWGCSDLTDSGHPRELLSQSVVCRLSWMTGTALEVTVSSSDTVSDFPIARKEIWNWQENVKGGVTEISGKVGVATRYYSRIQRRSAQDKAAYLFCSPPDVPVGNHSFSSTAAIVIHAYNGMGNKIVNGRQVPAHLDDRDPFSPDRPCELGSDKRWYWNPFKKYKEPPYYYVDRIEIEHE